MAQEWYYTQADRKVGPVQVKELRRAAAGGELGPTDLVWTEGMAEWREARTVKGLGDSWGDPPPVAPRLPATPDLPPVAGPPRGSPSPAEQAWLVGLGLCCCFPAGLVLVWRHPRLTKRTKWVVTAVVAVLFLLLVVTSPRSNGDPSKKPGGAASGSKASPAEQSTDPRKLKAEEFESEYGGKFKLLSKAELLGALGSPDAIQRVTHKRNVCLYVWKLTGDRNIVAGVIETIDGSNSVILMSMSFDRTPSDLSRMMRALEETNRR